MSQPQETTVSGHYQTFPDEEERKREEVIATANQIEQQLTEEESNIDLSKMHLLDLGEHSNYKTKLCQKRWEIQRNIWVNNRVETDKDPKEGVASKPFPKGDGDPVNEMNRRKEKRTMKSETSPYEAFDGFYPLEEVIDAYVEVWYKDSSSEESD